MVHQLCKSRFREFLKHKSNSSFSNVKEKNIYYYIPCEKEEEEDAWIFTARSRLICWENPAAMTMTSYVAAIIHQREWINLKKKEILNCLKLNSLLLWLYSILCVNRYSEIMYFHLRATFYRQLFKRKWKINCEHSPRVTNDIFVANSG